VRRYCNPASDVPVTWINPNDYRCAVRFLTDSDRHTRSLANVEKGPEKVQAQAGHQAEDLR